MKYIGYRLNFLAAVHFGSGSLDDAGNRLYADTLFSALCHEALQEGVLDEFLKAVTERNLRLSDAFPCHGDTYYVPKPMIAVEGESSSDIKKKAKKLEFIPADRLREYLNGSMDISAESEVLKDMGKAEIRTNAAVSDAADTVPYSVGAYRFNDGWSLYVLISYEDDEDLYMVEDLLISLGYSGVGGRRSSGLGRFELNGAKLPSELLDSLTESSEGTVMTLSVSMCDDSDLEKVLDGASYLMMKRSGFISSATYAQTPLKKQDFYCFKSGSVFKGCFNGVLKDVSVKGNHPVFRYAMPVFMEVGTDD